MKKVIALLSLIFILSSAFESPKLATPIPNKPIELNDSNFNRLVLQSDDVVLVDFWAVWCGPCRRINPMLDRLAKEYDGQAVIGKVNVDKSKLVPMKYNIKNLPTILIFKNGKQVDKTIGLVPYKTLEAKLKKQL